MIRSFADIDTERLSGRVRVRRYPAELLRAMLRQIVPIDAAEQIEDLRAPPGTPRGSRLAHGAPARDVRGTPTHELAD